MSTLNPSHNDYMKALADSEQKKIVLDRIAEAWAADIISRQGEYAEELISDLKKAKSSAQKKQILKNFYEEKSGAKLSKRQQKEIDGCFPGNHVYTCVATLDIPQNIAAQDSLGRVSTTANIPIERMPQPIQDISNQSIDTGCLAVMDEHCDYVIPKSKDPKSKDSKVKYPTASLTGFVNPDGSVVVDITGEPKLKDGDLMFVSSASNSSSGFHCIRINVDDKGKVTYSAGNSEHNKSPLFKYDKKSGQMKPIYTSCRVYEVNNEYTSTIRQSLNEFSTEQLASLSEAFNVSLSSNPKSDMEKYSLAGSLRNQNLSTLLPLIMTSPVEIPLNPQIDKVIEIKNKQKKTTSNTKITQKSNTR